MGEAEREWFLLPASKTLRGLGLWPLLLGLACLDGGLLTDQAVFRTMEEGEAIGGGGTVGTEMWP